MALVITMPWLCAQVLTICPYHFIIPPEGFKRVKIILACFPDVHAATGIKFHPNLCKKLNEPDHSCMSAQRRQRALRSLWSDCFEQQLKGLVWDLDSWPGAATRSYRLIRMIVRCCFTFFFSYRATKANGKISSHWKVYSGCRKVKVSVIINTDQYNTLLL